LAEQQNQDKFKENQKQKKDKKRKSPGPYYHFEDGAIDLFIGTVVMQIGLNILLTRLGISSAWGPIIVFVLCGIIYVSCFFLWKGVVLQRLGFINIVPINKNKFSIFFIFGSIFIVLVAVLGIVISSRPAMTQNTVSTMLLRGLPIFILLCAGGFLFEIVRFFLYAFLIAAIFPLGAFLDSSTGWIYTYPVLIMGGAAIIWAVGLYFFITFLKNHPK